VSTTSSDEYGGLIFIGLLIAGIWWWNSGPEGEVSKREIASPAMVPATGIGSEPETGIGPMPIAPPASVAAPAHNYDFKDAGMYGYVSAVSDEDKAKGKALGDVTLVAYRGAAAGVHRLTLLDDAGRTIGDYECEQPCRVIRALTNGVVSRRVAYNPGSIIGAAFQDALGGRLATLPKSVTPQNRQQLEKPQQTAPRAPPLPATPLLNQSPPDPLKADDASEPTSPPPA
jgi:hypothetical protein